MKGFKPAIFLRGMAMGAADIVPGVSGGTIAFITGIYDELIESLTSFNLQAVRVLRQQGIGALWRHVNGGFLLSLVTGVLIAALSLAKAISYALEHHPVPLAGFFFGLVLASAILIYRQIPERTVVTLVLLILGAGVAIGIGEVRPASIAVTPLSLFLAGAVAICAMILPGISGSFILLLIGMYGPVIDAIKSMDLLAIALFGAGCATGLMLFVRLLSWLLHHYHGALLSFLSGLLIGSLSIIWPWKLDSVGQAGGLGSGLELANSWPWHYAEVADAHLLLTGFLAAFGVILVLAIERLAGHKQSAVGE
ncbi:DUF368 domain-containing protein [Spongiibacter taiwanensis]|uniref:DUF368 domain-containing protein n=1 Tax=Spongiibacter taiwanensis TaxID=1748242 RepID=UPI0020352952|nr:DUF368 domain-containing protein [Spongiibacter taiwanensis]USA43605.1 DUF368 domain-containing protein [Spongiibacter taiwanensis]